MSSRTTTDPQQFAASLASARTDETSDLIAVAQAAIAHLAAHNADAGQGDYLVDRSAMLSGALRVLALAFRANELAAEAVEALATVDEHGGVR